MHPTTRRAVPDEPHDLLLHLRSSDEQNNGQPRLPPGQEEIAREWLARILVDVRWLFAHLRLLEDFYQARFREPLPRYYWVEGVEQPPAEPPAGFPHNTLLPEDRAVAVTRQGPGVLRPGQLAALLLNPLALWDLSDRVNFDRADYWRPRMEQVGRQLMEEEGIVISIPGVDDRPTPR